MDYLSLLQQYLTQPQIGMGQLGSNAGQIMGQAQRLQNAPRGVYEGGLLNKAQQAIQDFQNRPALPPKLQFAPISLPQPYQDYMNSRAITPVPISSGAQGGGNTTGSFAGPIGGAGIINAAMAARGAAGSPLGQISPTAPGFNPALAAQRPVPMPPGGGAPLPMGGAPTPMQPTQAPPPAPQQPQPQQPSGLFTDPQEKIIVQALIKQLERLDKAKTIALGGGAGIGY